MQTSQHPQGQDVGHEVHTGAVLVVCLLSLTCPQVQPAVRGVSTSVGVCTSTNTVHLVGFVVYTARPLTTIPGSGSEAGRA